MLNTGYIGFSRSIRSQNAIESYELPLSHFTKSVIDEFLSEFEEEFSEHIELLKSLTVKNWKQLAKFNGRTSWHHTSNHFNKTDHYSLYNLAESAIENINNLIDIFKEEKKKIDYKYGIITVCVFGGTRNHPTLIGHDTVTGITKGDWLYFEKCNAISKYKTTANKVTEFNTYNSYAELVKANPNEKGTKSYFTKLLKEI